VKASDGHTLRVESGTWDALVIRVAQAETALDRLEQAAAAVLRAWAEGDVASSRPSVLVELREAVEACAPCHEPVRGDTPR